MRKSRIFDIGLLLLVLATPLGINQPGLTALLSQSLGTTKTTIVAQKTAQVNLNLTVEKQILKQDNQGRKLISWLPLQGNVTVQPGDILRYRFSGKNVSDRAVKNLAVVQPIPRQMIYLPASATSGDNNPVKLTYSIDNGKTFVEKPTIRVKLSSGQVQQQPAPPSAYTHIRWAFLQAIAPGSEVTGSFQVRVR